MVDVPGGWNVEAIPRGHPAGGCAGLSCRATGAMLAGWWATELLPFEGM
jgi:hypothetical protein